MAVCWGLRAISPFLVTNASYSCVFVNSFPSMMSLLNSYVLYFLLSLWHIGRSLSSFSSSGVLCHFQIPLSSEFFLSILQPIFFKDLFICCREREKSVPIRGKAEAEGERISSRLPLSMEPNTGLDLMTLRSWPELKPRVERWTSWAPQVRPPAAYCFKINFGGIIDDPLCSVPQSSCSFLFPFCLISHFSFTISILREKQDKERHVLTLKQYTTSEWQLWITLLEMTQ